MSKARVLEMAAAMVLLLMSRSIADAQSRPEPDDERKENALERIVNYPFKSEEDLKKVGEMTVGLAALARDTGMNTSSGFVRFLIEVASFISPETAPGEQLKIVSFAESDDKAVRRLRDSAGLAPPDGGAILRVYWNRNAMAEPIAALFGGGVEGITRWCRFIAVSAEGKSLGEVNDTISHELAHAYICSLLGLESDVLPKWFHEGTALYLSDARDRYVSQTGFGAERISFSTIDYEEYKLVFRYLDSEYGERAVEQFIRRSVEQRSVDEPLRILAAATSYEAVRDRAWKWKREREKISAYWGWGIAGAAAALLALYVRRRRRIAAERVLQELENAERSKRRFARRVARDLERLQQAETFEEALAGGRVVQEDIEEVALMMIEEGRALAAAGRTIGAREKYRDAMRTAPWSARVESEAQLAMNELKGIIR